MHNPRLHHQGRTVLPATPRIDQIRKQLESEPASLKTLALVAEQLCEKTSDSAVKLRWEAMNKLSDALEIDHHPLLRRRSGKLRQKDIPANRHLLALRKITEFVLKEAEAAQETTNKRIQLLRSRIERLQFKIKYLRVELDEHIESLTEDRAQIVRGSKSSLSTARSEFIAQVSAMARARWPKRSELASASQELEKLNRQLAAVTPITSDPSVSREQLLKRLRNIARVLDAAKLARLRLKEQGEADRQIEIQKVSNAARRAMLEREEERKRKEAVDRLQDDLDRENLLVQATAKRLVKREALVDVIEDLKRQGVSEPMRIAQQATIYARNILLSHKTP